MVLTKKFSEFDNADLSSSDNRLVGYGDGINIKADKVTRWTTATRPASPFNGLAGYNIDFSQIEYFDIVTNTWIQLVGSATPPALTWVSVTASSTIMVQEHGYVPNNVGVVEFTLPAACAFGHSVAISGLGSGGWKIIFNTGQNVVLGNIVASTTVGTLESTNSFDQVELLCVVENTTFMVRNVIGNINIT